MPAYGLGNYATGKGDGKSPEALNESKCLKIVIVPPS